MIRRPDRRRELLSVLRAISPGGAEGWMRERHLMLARALRKVGGHTYAPVFRRSRPWLLRHLRPEGLEHLDALHAAGSGAVILGSHVGLNAWVGQVLRQLGYPIRLTQRLQTTADHYMLMRRDGSLHSVLPYPPPGQSGPHLKSLYEMLSRGTWVQHTGDFPVPQDGLCGTYMGRPVQCAPGPWVLARLARVPVVPVLMLANERREARLVVCPPIRIEEPAASLREGLEGPFQTYLDFVSSRVSRAPWNMGLKHWQKILGQD
jgi:KDO2-lipid IV(A) lauroyltransferase